MLSRGERVELWLVFLEFVAAVLTAQVRERSVICVAADECLLRSEPGEDGTER